MIRRSRRLLAHDLHEDRSDRPREGQASRQEFIENDPQAVDVAERAGIQVVVDLFGRHVGGCPDDHSFAGHPAFIVCVDSSCQAEVHQDRFLFAIDHDVGRFQIAVNDAFAMRVNQSECELADERSGRAFGNRLTRLEEIGQRPALDVGHRDEMHAVDLADVVNRADVGVPEIRCRPGLTVEALDQLLGIGIGEAGRLQRNLAMQLCVFRKIDVSHCADTKPPDNPISPEPLGEGRLLVPLT